MMYPEEIVQPMRAELTRLGFKELRTPVEVDGALANSKGTVLVVVNSICGCAAGKARPAVARALEQGAKPDALTTVFAGQDTEATARARDYLSGYPPSSPSIACCGMARWSTCSNAGILKDAILSRSPRI